MVELGSVNATVVGSSPTVLSLYHLWIILLVLDPLAQPTQSAPLVRHYLIGILVLGSKIVPGDGQTVPDR